MTDGIDSLPGIKAADLRPCIICGGRLTANGITFYRVRIDRCALDARALRELRGSMDMLGGMNGTTFAIAQAMGAAPEYIARCLGEASDEAFVCDECAIRRGQAVAVMAETIHNRR